MAVWALGINHTTAPVDIRGRFAFAVDQIAPTLQGLRQSLDGSNGRPPEAAILSTCNRTEIYCQASQPTAILNWFAAYHQLDAAQLLLALGLVLAPGRA